MKRTFENEMERFRKMIYGIKENASIKERIAPIYPEERLAIGETLYLASKEASFAQIKEKNEALDAIDALDAAKDELHNALVKARKAGRYFFKNDLEITKALQLNKNIPSAYSSWKNMLEIVFKAIKANETILDKFAIVGLSAEQIDQIITKVDSLDQLQLNAEKEDGEAQVTTQNKLEAYLALKLYCSDLLECLNLFYEDDERQKLEEIGILVK